MDGLHLSGIDGVLWCQQQFKGQEDWLLLVSQLCDPRSAFLVLFPIAYYINKKLGCQLMWSAVLSEWLNAVFKWMLHGERPYWWVHETSLYGGRAAPHLEQTRLTCETGPGSPSGHAMVTSCAVFTLLLSNHTPFSGGVSKAAAWLVTGGVLLAGGISRCYIAAHFPHQVVAGVITGYILAHIIKARPLDDVSLRTYVITSATLLLSGPLIYSLISSLGFDPNWSVALATKWCARSEWVYLDTTLFFAIARDAACLLGYGLALQLADKVEWADSRVPVWRRAVCLLFSLLVARAQEYVPLPKQTELFYTFAVFKYALLPTFLTVVIPRLVLGSDKVTSKKDS